MQCEQHASLLAVIFGRYFGLGGSKIAQHCGKNDFWKRGAFRPVFASRLLAAGCPDVSILIAC
jgi:hypothetical protein